MRIVSLLPSATEIVCALGLTDSLVGISHDCDYPPEISGKPVLSEAIVTTDLPSGVIDTTIRGQVHKGKSVYHLDERQLTSLQPDLILTQELCAVCAPSYSLVKQAARLLEAQTRLVSLEPENLAGILDNILLVGDLTGRAAEATALADQLRGRIERVREAITGRPRPRVACIEWLDPLFVAGHWVPEMVALAGGVDVLGRAGEPSFLVSWQAIVAAEPDVIVVMPCGFTVPRTRQEVHLLTGRRGWADVRAVHTGQVYLTDASAYFNRPGPRIVTGVEILARILHAQVASAQLPADAFERLSRAPVEVAFPEPH
ncbi:MAG TPA: cobalamin-binding protein [bacterium]|nr:cobalamin-binding protein [bacterium]